MKKLLHIAWNELLLLLKDRMAVIWVVVLPLGMMLIGGLVFGGLGGGSEAVVIDLPVVDQDGGEMAAVVLDVLSQTGNLNVETVYDVETAPGGELWCATDGGLAHFDGTGWTGYGSQAFYAVQLAADGTVYALSGGEVLRLSGDQLEALPHIPGLWEAIALFIAPDGAVLGPEDADESGAIVVTLDLALAADKTVAPHTDIFTARQPAAYRF